MPTPNGYLQSDYWKSFTHKLWEKENECELCGAKKWYINKAGDKIYNKRTFVIHHKHYRTLYHEKRSDVMMLCRDCHNLAHKILRRKPTTDAIRALQEAVRKYFIYEE